MDTYISIDQGTTSSRAILFGVDGSILKTCQMEFEQIYPKPGWVEHNPEEIWETTKSVLKDLYHSELQKNTKLEGLGLQIREQQSYGIENLESQFTMQLFGKTEELQIFVSL